MAKQIKSIRFDEDILSVFEKYSALFVELFGRQVSFPAFVNEAVAKELYRSTNDLANWIADGSVVEVLPNNKIKKIEFSEVQVERIKELAQEALSVYGPYIE